LQKKESKSHQRNDEIVTYAGLFKVFQGPKSGPYN